MAKITIKELESQLKAKTAIAKTEGKKQRIACGSGLNINIQPNTAKADYYCRTGNTEIKIGAVNKISLANAFAKAEKIKSTSSKTNNQKDVDNTPKLGDFFLAWIEEKKLKLKSSSNRSSNLKALFNNTLYPLKDYTLKQITPKLVCDEISKVNQTTGNKHNAVQALTQCLKSALKRGILPFNPLIGLLQGTETPFPRARYEGLKYIKAKELKEKYFEPLKDTALIFRTFFLLIALTSFRFGECRLLKWSYIDFDKNIITIPPTAEGANKTGKELIKPMTKQVRLLLLKWREQSRNIKHSDYVFCTLQEDKTDHAIAENSIREQYKPNVNKASHVMDLHGLRKSMKTWQKENGIDELTSEQAITHEIRTTLQKTYDKKDYTNDILQALQLYNDYLETQLPKEFLQLIK